MLDEIPVLNTELLIPSDGSPYFFYIQIMNTDLINLVKKKLKQNQIRKDFNINFHKGVCLDPYRNRKMIFSYIGSVSQMPIFLPRNTQKCI